MKDYIDLMLTFARIGSITFGGGYAMLPIIERELVVKKGWATMDEVMDYFAIGQVTPGIIAVNVSTFIGYKRKGIPGGILSTLGFVFPSLVIITIIAAFLTNFSNIPLVQHAFVGIRVAVGALILDAVIKLVKGAVKDWKAVAICVTAFVLSAMVNASPVLLVIASALAGFLLYRPISHPKDPSGKGKTP
jgi:chromate transporter